MKYGTIGRKLGKGTACLVIAGMLIFGQAAEGQTPVAGVLAAVDSAGATIAGSARIVYLIPMASSIRNEWKELCQRQEREERAWFADRAKKQEISKQETSSSVNGSSPVKGAHEEATAAMIAERAEARLLERFALLQRRAAWRVTTSDRGEFVFDAIPKGAYWIASGMRTGPRQYHWLHRLTVPLEERLELTYRNATYPACDDGLP